MRSSAEPCRSCACSITGPLKLPKTYKTQLQQNRSTLITGSVTDTWPRNVISRLISKHTLLQHTQICSNKWQALMKNLHYLTGSHLYNSLNSTSQVLSLNHITVS
jgi:predicted molibdopterin-dependent oxidoreductase YjgC